MNKIYRFTYRTQCGILNVVVESSPSVDAAHMKARMHVEHKHSPMTLVKVEFRNHGTYSWNELPLAYVNA